MTGRWSRGARTIAACAIVMSTGWAAARPDAADAAPPANEQCLMCHAQGDLTSGEGAHARSLYVDAATLAGSPHAALACTACHSEAKGMPHPSRMKKVRCATCHADEARALMTSVHARVGASPRGAGDRAAGVTPAASTAPMATEEACAGCHGTHDMKPASRMGPDGCKACHARDVREYQGSVHGVALAHGDPEASTCRDCHGPAHGVRSHLDTLSTVSRGRLARTCAHCHADRALMARRKITIPTAYDLYAESVHGRSKNPNAATCNDCHESHRLLRANDPAASINRANIPTTCGRCHARAAKDFEASVHGTALARGVRQSPACNDCHGEHRIRGPRDPGSPVAAAGVTQTCAHCHEAAGIRETYGLPAGRLSSYRDSYHGLAARGGAPAVANCASCHDHHLILPSSDPRSSIAPANLPRTCGRCHPGAGERFARGAVHEAMANADRPVLRWVRVGYLWLIVLTIGGMLLHNGLDFLAKTRRRLREHLGLTARHAEASQRWFVRMTTSERAQHIALAVSFMTLVYTGFALKFPEGWPFAWLARLEGGYAWRSLIHRGAAVVMVGTALLHVVYLFTRRGREMLGAMRPRPSDATDAAANLSYLVGARPQPPQFEHFGYIEKAEYWALVWGTFVMTATGVVLWFENQSMQWLNKWLLDLATLVHYYEAWLAFLAIVVWHIYQTVLNPDVYPMNWTWLTGRISEEQLRHEHGAEWTQMQVEEAAAAARAEAEARGESAGGSELERSGESREE